MSVDSARGVTCDMLDAIWKVAELVVTWDRSKISARIAAKIAAKTKKLDHYMLLGLYVTLYQCNTLQASRSIQV
jgi:hypothetical protein